MFKPILHSIRMTHGETYQCTNCTQHSHPGDYRIQIWVWKWFHKRSRCLLSSDFLYFATEEHKPICVSGTLHCVCLAHSWCSASSFGCMRTRKRACLGTASANTQYMFRLSWCYQRPLWNHFASGGSGPGREPLQMLMAPQYWALFTKKLRKCWSESCGNIWKTMPVSQRTGGSWVLKSCFPYSKIPLTEILPS